MLPTHPDSLAKFVERHRAEFDVHEPRPELWAALEHQLAGPSPVPAADLATETPVRPLGPAAPRRPWVQRYGVAAALALLVMAAGASEAWKSHRAVPLAAEPGVAAEVPASQANTARYLGGNLAALAATDRNDLTDERLATAVNGMETYYVGQLNERKSELRQLADSAAGSPTAEWRHELASLDSSYRQLKAELGHHPQPEVVLTAMNRNLQIRLDLLDRQLQTRAMAEARPTAAPRGLVLADSRHLPW